MNNEIINEITWKDKIIKKGTRLRRAPIFHQNTNGENYDLIVQNIYVDNEKYEVFFNITHVLENTLTPYKGLDHFGAKVEDMICGIWWLDHLGVEVIE